MEARDYVTGATRAAGRRRVRGCAELRAGTDCGRNRRGARKRAAGARADQLGDVGRAEPAVSRIEAYGDAGALPGAGIRPGLCRDSKLESVPGNYRFHDV